MRTLGLCEFCNKNLKFHYLLGGRHKEGRSRGTGHDLTSLKHQKGEGQIAVDVVLNIGILKPPVAPEWF